MCTHGFTAQLASYVILHETALQYPLVTHGKRVTTCSAQQSSVFTTSMCLQCSSNTSVVHPQLHGNHAARCLYSMCSLFQIRECRIDLLLLKVFVGVLDYENNLHTRRKHENLVT